MGFRRCLYIGLLFTSLCLETSGFTVPSGALRTSTYAQSVSDDSWDFEDNALGDWQSSGEVAVVGMAIDPLTANTMSTVAQGQYSVQVGDAVPWGTAGSQFSAIEREVTVASVANPVLQYSYAVVANDPPSHPEIEKPYFQLQIRDLTTGELLPVSDLKYTSQTNQEWFLGQSPDGQSVFQSSFGIVNGDRWVFIPWKQEKIDLQGRAGHQLLIRFELRDCDPSAHAAYGYLDSIHVGSEIILPPLPALVSQPVPAGAPADPGLFAPVLNPVEQWRIWPLCLLIPLLLAGILGFMLIRGRVVGATLQPEPVGTRPPSSPRQPDSRANEGGSTTHRGPENTRSRDDDGGSLRK